MVRSTNIAWKAGLALMAVAFSWQQPALADDGLPETVAVPRQPIEPTEVRVILQPPADEEVFALRPPGRTNVPSFRLVKPADHNAGPRPVSEPEKIREKANSTKPPLMAEPSARVASLPADDAKISPPRPEPVKAREDVADVTPAVIPPLPERLAFRTVLHDIEPVEEQAAASSGEEWSEPAPLLAKVNSAFRSLTDIFPGKTRESGASSGNEEDERRRAKSAPASARLTGNEQTEERKSTTFLDKLRFWDN